MNLITEKVEGRARVSVHEHSKRSTHIDDNDENSTDASIL